MRLLSGWSARWGSLGECAYVLAPAGAVIPTTVDRPEGGKILELLIFPYGTRTSILFEVHISIDLLMRLG